MNSPSFLGGMPPPGGKKQRIVKKLVSDAQLESANRALVQQEELSVNVVSHVQSLVESLKGVSESVSNIAETFFRATDTKGMNDPCTRFHFAHNDFSRQIANYSADLGAAVDQALQYAAIFSEFKNLTSRRDLLRSECEKKRAKLKRPPVPGEAIDENDPKAEAFWNAHELYATSLQVQYDDMQRFLSFRSRFFETFLVHIVGGEVMLGKHLTRVMERDLCPLLDIIQNHPADVDPDTVLGSVENLVVHPVAVDHFRRFMESEFSVENLDFYEAVIKFRQLSTDAQRKSYAEKIWKTFVKPGAEQQVNVDAAVVQQLEKRLETSSDVDVFDPAAEMIVELMTRDTFARFKKTPAFDEVASVVRRNQFSFWERALEHGSIPEEPMVEALLLKPEQSAKDKEREKIRQRELKEEKEREKQRAKEEERRQREEEERRVKEAKEEEKRQREEEKRQKEEEKRRHREKEKSKPTDGQKKGKGDTEKAGKGGKGAPAAAASNPATPAPITVPAVAAPAPVVVNSPAEAALVAATIAAAGQSRSGPTAAELPRMSMMFSKELSSGRSQLRRISRGEAKPSPKSDPTEAVPAFQSIRATLRPSSIGGAGSRSSSSFVLSGSHNAGGQASHGASRGPSAPRTSRASEHSPRRTSVESVERRSVGNTGLVETAPVVRGQAMEKVAAEPVFESVKEKEVMQPRAEPVAESTEQSGDAATASADVGLSFDGRYYYDANSGAYYDPMTQQWYEGYYGDEFYSGDNEEGSHDTRQAGEMSDTASTGFGEASSAWRGEQAAQSYGAYGVGDQPLGSEAESATAQADAEAEFATHPQAEVEAEAEFAAQAQAEAEAAAAAQAQAEAEAEAEAAAAAQAQAEAEAEAERAAYPLNQSEEAECVDGIYDYDAEEAAAIEAALAGGDFGDGDLAEPEPHVGATGLPEAVVVVEPEHVVSETEVLPELVVADALAQEHIVAKQPTVATPREASVPSQHATRPISQPTGPAPTPPTGAAPSPTRVRSPSGGSSGAAVSTRARSPVAGAAAPVAVARPATSPASTAPVSATKTKPVDGTTSGRPETAPAASESVSSPAERCSSDESGPHNFRSVLRKVEFAPVRRSPHAPRSRAEREQMLEAAYEEQRQQTAARARAAPASLRSRPMPPRSRQSQSLPTLPIVGSRGGAAMPSASQPAAPGRCAPTVSLGSAASAPQTPVSSSSTPVRKEGGTAVEYSSRSSESESESVQKEEKVEVREGEEEVYSEDPAVVWGIEPPKARPVRPARGGRGRGRSRPPRGS